MPPSHRDERLDVIVAAAAAATRPVIGVIGRPRASVVIVVMRGVTASRARRERWWQRRRGDDQVQRWAWPAPARTAGRASALKGRRLSHARAKERARKSARERARAKERARKRERERRAVNNRCIHTYVFVPSNINTPVRDHCGEWCTPSVAFGPLNRYTIERRDAVPRCDTL